MTGKKRILISGGTGKFATEIKKLLKDTTVYAPSKCEMDVYNLSDIDYAIRKFNPDIFIHSGAFTRPMIKHDQQPDESIKANIIGTSNVVLSCMTYDVKLVYISTDYVYPGNAGNYSENDPLLPFTKYGWSKLGGECAVMLYENSLVLRISMSNRPFPHAKAFSDVKKSLLFDDEAAKIILRLLDKKGIINVGGKSQTIYEFVSKHNPDVGKISLNDVNAINIAPDTSMCIDRLAGLLNDKAI